MKNTFAHDLRTLLNHILGFNDLLADDLLRRSAPGEVIESLKAINEKGQCLQIFIETWFGDIQNNEDWRTPALEALASIQGSCTRVLPSLTDSEVEDIRRIEESASKITFMLIGQDQVRSSDPAE
jgi:signal transduction histidine kinase